MTATVARLSPTLVVIDSTGESMALVTPDPPAPLALGGPMRLDVAGAESTVACYLAMLGVRSAWDRSRSQIRHSHARSRRRATA